MRTIGWMTLVALAAWMLPGAIRSAQAEVNVAFIDLDRVFNDYHKTETAHAQLKQEEQKSNDEMEQKMSEYKALKEEFDLVKEEAQNSAFSEEVRKQKRDQAEEMLIELKAFEKEIRDFKTARGKQLEGQVRRLRKRLVGEIQTSIDTYAKEQGFTAVIDYSGETFNGVPVVVYHDKELDITEKIIGIINEFAE